MSGMPMASTNGGGDAVGRAETDQPFVRRLTISIERQPAARVRTDRMSAIGWQFGIPMSCEPYHIRLSRPIPVGPGKLILIVGPSGSGKSTILADIHRQIEGSPMVHRIQFPTQQAIIDAVAPWGPLTESVKLLTRCGLGEPRLWLRTFGELSDGERFRARLARAVADQRFQRNAAPILCDEFGSSLHRRAAHALAFHLRKLTKDHGLCLILACHDPSIERDLSPDVVVRLSGGQRGIVSLTARDRAAGFSLRRRLRIELGRKKDYQTFGAMHYRSTDELGFVHKVFVLREGHSGTRLGIVVYAYGPLELSLRNHATRGLFAGRPDRLNENMRILRRLVIHPDVRGCGLGHFLVEKTLGQVGTPYVECLASMGAVNPVFEKAGMRRIGQVPVSTARMAAARALKRIGVDPLAPEFPHAIACNRRVRLVVMDVVRKWYATTTGGGGARRVKRQTPVFLARAFRGLIGMSPVYYLWHCDARVRRALRVCASPGSRRSTDPAEKTIGARDSEHPR